LSMVPGVIASAAALNLWQTFPHRPSLIFSSILLGVGISTMHYIGMAAMELPGVIRYEPRLFALSLIVAVLLAYLALRIQSNRGHSWRSELPGALLMGSAISGMHYIAMSAAYFVRTDTANISISVLSPTYLALAVLLVTGLVVMLAVAVASAYRNREIAEELQKSEERWKFALEGGGEGVWDWDIPSGRVVYSRCWKEILGYSEDEIGGDLAEWESRVHPDDKARVMQAVEDHLAGRTPTFYCEYRCLAKGDSWKWILSRGMLVNRNADDQPLRMVGTHTDITERRQAEESAQLASLVYQNSSEAMMVMDAEGVIITVNPAFTELTGYQSREVIGKHANLLSSGQHDQAFHDELWEIVCRSGRWQGELWGRRKNGGIYAEWLSINTIYNDDGSPHRRVALFSDITKKKEFEELIWKEANFDLLTGLPNRRMFLNTLDDELKKARRTGNPLTLMFIDLDRFKEVNDTLGHDTGDMLLQEAAKRIRACVRETDTVARMGGDEFTVILSGQSQQNNIARVYGGILYKLSQPFFLHNEAAYVSASIGITIFPEDATTSEELLKNADQAMYAAKNQGRNRYCYFTPSMQEAAQTRMRLINDLRNAILEQQFSLVYQPIVDLATGNIQKAEALVRWDHPVHGRVNPAEFIPVAEDTGLIVELGDWVFREAAAEVRRLRRLIDSDFQISVNKSAVQCHAESNIHLDWAVHLQELGLPGNSITVEITESMLLDSNAAIKEKLSAFRNTGMQISLDDFGTGYSSLSYLKKFDIDYLKIDRSFVSSLKRGSADLALCEAIIVMAHKLGMKVIAEGVETVDQCDLLAEAGCDYAQGYLFSIPVSADELERMLELPVFYIA
ncbi:MAG TPA: EAL domain-containing protein, partial [Methylophilaceae bacterium]|nr:EAL domain-containing protein [Methylophilaceae bacterium]